MELKNLSVAIFMPLLFCACALPNSNPALLDGSNIDQSIMKVIDKTIQVNNINITQTDADKLKGDFKLLTTPDQFGCLEGEDFYASSGNKIYYYQLGGYTQTWFRANGSKNSPDLSSDKFSYLGNCYFKNGNQIIYQGVALKDADLQTFKLLDSEKYSNDAYALDKKQVYQGHQIVPGDPKTYQILDRNYTKDKDAVYFRTRILLGADPRTFQVLGENYSKDHNNVYFNSYSENEINGVMADADPASFKVLKHYYLGKDKKAVFSYGKKTEVRDAESFEIISNIDNNVFYARDKNFVYFDLKVANQVDPNSFKVLPGDYAQDKNKVFFRGKEIFNADSKSHEVINFLFSKDQNKVFYMGKAIPDADPKTFQLLGDYYSKDSKNAFFRDKRIQGADLATFKTDPQNNTFAQDKNFLYYDGKLVYSSDTDAPAKP